MFHVTSLDNAEYIWNNGLQSDPPNEKWVEKRREFNRKLDEKGNELYDDWVDRTNGIYFWVSYEKARRYAMNKLHPAIVEISDPSSIELWQAPTEEIEMYFEHHMNQDPITLDEAEELVRQCEPWTGEMNEKLEVWTQSPIGGDQIRNILDSDGNPLEF